MISVIDVLLCFFLRGRFDKSVYKVQVHFGDDMTKNKLFEELNAISYKSYVDHPCWKWRNRILYMLFFGMLFFSILMSYFLIETRIGVHIASNAWLSELMLTYFQRASLWVNATLYYKEEMTGVFFFYLFSLSLSLLIVLYFFVLNWQRALIVAKLTFEKLKAEQDICKRIPLYIFIIVLFLGLSFLFFTNLKNGGYESPILIESYKPAAGLHFFSEFYYWNSFWGIGILIWVKTFLATMVLFFALLTATATSLCFFDTYINK